MDIKKITVGIATMLGVAGAIAAALVPVLGEIANAAEPLGIDPAFWIKVSASLGVVVMVGRYAQAIVASWKGDPLGGGGSATDVEVDGLPSDPHEAGVS